MKHQYKLLAIETSCDETAAAVVKIDRQRQSITPLSSVVASQIALHRRFGGVFPEMASRAHSQKILPVVAETLQQASNKLQVKSRKKQTREKISAACNLPLVTCNFIDAIAVTAGPGLIGSLIVGTEFARGLAAALNLPVVPVNHLEGHIYSNFIRVNLKSQNANLKSNSQPQTPNSNPKFPLIALVVSGGHTMLVLMRRHLDYKVIGSTLDDAAGEAFDKTARMLGLPYPGGPALEKLARDGNPRAFDFPRAMMGSDNFDFSFSGLKTAVFYKLRELGLVDNKAEPMPPSATSVDPHALPLSKGEIKRGWSSGDLKADVTASFQPLDSARSKLKIKSDAAASFQQAVIDVLVNKTLRAADKLKVKSIVIGGGVIANSALRAAFAKESRIKNYELWMSPKELATDNAFSIALAGTQHFLAGNTISWQKLEANASLKL